MPAGASLAPGLQTWPRCYCYNNLLGNIPSSSYLLDCRTALRTPAVTLCGGGAVRRLVSRSFTGLGVLVGTTCS